jgi:pyruvate/2-oxoglutarate dehydrogenase complex dihydrolipoamide acyltransferase (E2) component
MVGKKLRKAVKRLSKDLDELREENRDLAEGLEERVIEVLERQAESNRALTETLGTYLDRLDRDVRERGEERDSGPAEDGGGIAEAQEPDDGLEVTEAAERKAREFGVDLSGVRGTGSGGRILVREVEEAAG